MTPMQLSCLAWLSLWTTLLLLSSSVYSFSSESSSSFSLSHYHKARALETSNSMDASRLHFQILFVDDDNAQGRIAEGLLAKLAEHNDALFVLFPASATIASSRNAPRDAAAPNAAVQVCHALHLCESISTAIGTSFDLSYLDEYDLVIPMNDDIRSLILRSLSVDDQAYYAPKLRLYSEFLSPEFCSTEESCRIAPETLVNMLEPELRDKVTPYLEEITDRSSSVFGDDEGPAQAAWILAAAGVTRFCLDTMDAQFEDAFSTLLEKNFKQLQDLEQLKWHQADDQLRKCSHAVTGYFSPEQRKRRIERHLEDLRVKLNKN
jgi:hypothetical protein